MNRVRGHTANSTATGASERPISNGVNIIGRRKLWYSISATVIGLCIVAIVVFGLKLGIDFTGGTVIEVEGNANSQTISEIAAQASINNPSINSSGQQRYLIRYKTDENADTVKQEFESKLQEAGLEVVRTDQIGPSVSSDLARNAFLSLGVMSLVVVAYITYSFRKMPKGVSPFSFGVATVIAAFLHDAVFVVGVFALLGWLLGVEVDSFIITALLTVIGFSIHDTIVVFDRIREKLQALPTGQASSERVFAELAEESVEETMVRSLNTSLVIVLVLLALFLFGGASTRYFVLALLLGMVSGTYSSIFIAAPLLVTWNNRSQRKRPKGKSQKA